MKILLIFLILLGITPPAQTAESRIKNDSMSNTPTRIHVNYTVKTNIGDGELNEIIDFSQKNDQYMFNITSDAQATGVYKMINPGKILRSSQGIVTENGLQPNYYSDQRVNDQLSLALFDWKNQILTIKHNDEETQKPLSTGTLDRLSLPYNFILTPINDTLNSDLLAVHVTDGRSLKLMQFKVSRETLITPLGELDTIVLTKQHTNSDKVQRKIWLSPAYHMIPVYIQSIEQDGLEIARMIAKIDIDYATKTNCCKQ